MTPTARSSQPAESAVAPSPASRRRMPQSVLELIRLLVIVFFAGAGFQIGSEVDPGHDVLGSLNGTAVGLILGSGLGYVLGGVLGRTTATTAEAGRSRLQDVRVEDLLAGALGSVSGVLVGAGVAWPVFFLPQAYLAFPLFGLVLVVLGYLGYQIGVAKRDGVLAVLGSQAGVRPRETPTSVRDRVVDSSVAIDGRIVDVVRAGFLHGRMLVPTPVLAELQGLADAGDDLRRSRGRRGLEVLETLQREPGVDLQVLELDVPGVPEVDAKLVRICLDRGAALLTLDTNLARAASLAGCPVLNLHALALALRPSVVVGDEVLVLLIKPGKESGQAVGYLDDGSMVVVEHARGQIGQEVPVAVTSVLTTANGRLVFGRTDRRSSDGRPEDEPVPLATAERAPRRSGPVRRSS